MENVCIKCGASRSGDQRAKTRLMSTLLGATLFAAAFGIGLADGPAHILGPIILDALDAVPSP